MFFWCVERALGYMRWRLAYATYVAVLVRCKNVALYVVAFSTYATYVADSVVLRSMVALRYVCYWNAWHQFYLCLLLQNY